MPRVHGIETQRRRHGVVGRTTATTTPATTAGGSTTFVSLSTPFSKNNFANTSSSSSSSSSLLLSRAMREDDLSFHGTQPSLQREEKDEEEEVPGTQNPNFPTTTTATTTPRLSTMTFIPHGGDADDDNNNKKKATKAMTAAAANQQQPPPSSSVYHPSFLLHRHQGGRGATSITSNNKSILTKITPRDKCQLDGMEFGTSSFSVSNIFTTQGRGNNNNSNSNNNNTTAALLDTLGTNENDRQYSQPAASLMDGQRLGGSSISIAATAADPAAAMTSKSLITTTTTTTTTTAITSPTNTTTSINENNCTRYSSVGGGGDDDDDDESGLLDHNTTKNTAGTDHVVVVAAAAAATTNDEDVPIKKNTDNNNIEAGRVLNSTQNNSNDKKKKKKVKYKDGMDDDTDVPTSEEEEEDGDEEQSVDLLLNDDDDDDDKNSNGITPPPKNNIQRSNSNKQRNHHSNKASSSSSSSSLSPIISPATQTLDRLSMIGTQDGGAELCVELSANAVRTTTPMRRRGGGKAKSPLDETDNAIAVASSATAEESSTSTPPLTKQRCIHNLKEYFMSTQNSAQFAENKFTRNSGGMELPPVTFCHNCNSSSIIINNNNNNNLLLSQLPHHGLCPKHEDFFVSGSYEILNLIVDGNLLGCNACIYHFENGRPNKQFVHLENCKRYKAKSSRVVGKKGQKLEASSFGSVGGVNSTQLSASNGTRRPLSNKRGIADKTGDGQGDGTEKQCSSSNSNNKNVASRDNNGKQESPELSDYERLRLRNIQRNESRLAALGLLVPSNQKSVNNKKSNKEGFLSRSDPNNDSESKKVRLKGKKKETEAQKRTQPKRHKQKYGDDEQTQRHPPALTEKENSSASKNQTYQYADDVRRTNDDIAIPAAKPHGKSIEPASLVEAAKAGCRKCTLEWQTDTNDPTKSHDAVCPRGNLSHSSNTQQQQKPKGSKKSFSRTPPHQNSSIAQTKASQVTSRLSTPALQEARHIGATTTMADTSRNVIHDGQSMVMDVYSNLLQSAMQKGFSAAFLRGKTEEELLVLLSSGRDSQKLLQPILPQFIRDFIAEADRNKEIPAPRGTKWLSCPNPWGKIGHEEGDFVVISPFQSESAADMVSVFHQGPNGSIPKRFVANPLEEGSPYHDTHRSPGRNGYSVLRLTRDRMGLRPWGFTVRLHEFGGACLVDSLEPLSPAEAAEDISGWTDKDTPSGLQLHDMIICVNGKSVGCMTEAELQIDLDICGSAMILVVARFDIEGNTNQNVTLEDLAMDWNDIGAGAPSRKKIVCFEDDESSEHVSELNRHPDFGMMNASSQVYRPGSHDDDNDSNEGESDSDDDFADKTEDAFKHRTQRLTSELESKSDKELMEKLMETKGSRNWNKITDSLLAKLLAKRGCIAAAKDESFQRLSCDSGGVAKDQVIEWMNRSETFSQYDQIMRTKWAENSFSMRIIDALKDAGYVKISGGSKTRWSLPEDIFPRGVHEQVVSSQKCQSDEEDSDGRKQGSRKVDDDVSELESKTDEELMEMLREGIKSGERTQLGRILAQRACLAAAHDENIQELNNVSGGVTKAQILEWMDRSEVFKGYKEMVRTQTKEVAFMKRLTEALTSLGYVRFGTGPNTRWALPEDIVPRVDVDAKQNFTSELFESKTDEELMEMLREGIKLDECTQLAKVLAKRACLAAAQDENIQELNNVSGGVTKAQVLEWMDRSEVFKGYKEMVRTQIKEEVFMKRLTEALTSLGYVRFGTGPNTRWTLPKDIVPRVDDDVRPNDGKRNGIKSTGNPAGKRKRESDTFAQHKRHFHQSSDESSHGSSGNEDKDEDEDEDDNPWLGCVCGRTHPAPIEVFWIQCGACDAWHNVAEDCVGFSEEAADSLDEWFCWSCKPPCPGMDL